MDSLDSLLLARIQFAFTVSFHILFPAFTIGLASYLAVLEGLWLWTKRNAFRELYTFWVKIFAVSFGMGVVSGIVLSYQFGTNWSRWSEAIGPTLGPLIAYEVLTAFFLEAGFLGIMLFGWKRVGNGLHFFATCMVAIGTVISAFWILSANSWMHTPVGFEIVDGQYHPTDWWQIIFNPSFPYRFVHMVLAAYLTTAFVVAAVGAWHLLRDRMDERARIMFSMAMWMAALVTPIQIVAGDLHGLNTLEHQPAKIAAMEGNFESHSPAPLAIFGWPDLEAGELKYKLEVPYLGSLILRHDLSSPIPALSEFPRDEWPNSTLIFWTFRVMVAIGFLMLGVGLWSLWLRWQGRLFDSRPFLETCTWLAPTGFIAILCGWVTTEVGRQPWIIYGLMRTADGVSITPGSSVAFSLALFVVTYTVVFGVGTWYLVRLMRGDLIGKPEDTPPEGRAARPLSGAGAALDPAE
jgi:cytochrome bd ubiquinol oxidase subunit I